MLTYWNDYPTIQKKLQIVCSLIEQRLVSRNQTIQETLTEFSAAGGKYLRPAFFFLFSEFGDQQKQNEQQLYAVAASLELLHMATLIHDDIIDDSPLRRGVETVQSRYGKDIAVYTGDLLFTEFFDLVIQAMNGSEYLAINAQSMRRLLLGELDQMNLRYNSTQSIEDYLLSINGKTAELFWLACQEGAYFGKAAPEIVELAGKIGRNIGIAFQAFDDILDYTAEEATLKKPILEDLAQGVYTIPLLLAKETHPDIFLPYLEKRETISREETQQVADLVVEHGGVVQAIAFAKSYTDQALADIAKLPESFAKNQLLHLAEEMLHRAH